MRSLLFNEMVVGQVLFSVSDQFFCHFEMFDKNLHTHIFVFFLSLSELKCKIKRKQKKREEILKFDLIEIKN